MIGEVLKAAGAESQGHRRAERGTRAWNAGTRWGRVPARKFSGSGIG
jgi:hypothetical protein